MEQGSSSQSGTGDDTDDVLLVADANQPLIHRFALGPGGATPLDPIFTGTPTTEIDVTPFVPASSARDDQAATERYLYAVSAIDSSILVVDYTEDPEGTAEADKTFGAVLPVLAGVSARANEENVESRNRVRFAFSNVRAIEVISPFYELEDEPNGTGKQVPLGDICNPTDGNAFALAQSASNMRGVFLAVSLSDGTMFFLDIYDLNAPCRGGSGIIACTLAETGPDRLASIRRHRERFRFTPATPRRRRDRRQPIVSVQLGAREARRNERRRAELRWPGAAAHRLSAHDEHRRRRHGARCVLDDQRLRLRASASDLRVLAGLEHLLAGMGCHLAGLDPEFRGRPWSLRR